MWFSDRRPLPPGEGGRRPGEGNHTEKSCPFEPSPWRFAASLSRRERDSFGRGFAALIPSTRHAFVTVLRTEQLEQSHGLGVRLNALPRPIRHVCHGNSVLTDGI